eukprot:6476504-Amphidinium_carterae.1
MDYRRDYLEKCSKDGLPYLEFAQKRTRTPVLAVGVCPAGGRIFRALNVETSLPSGTLGAVRSVLQQVQSELLEEQSLKVIALLSPHDTENPVEVSKVCEHSLTKWAGQGPRRRPFVLHGAAPSVSMH